ncbi:Integrator complex subunit 11 [Apophysomyces ossiformis]|uniref:Integrator complex subunit 11 n=1 Tax=Apophysomyces ossiformis TaxID=679940 RepID=A0A8H7BRA6_9FUNG|nr:Integrator complex subunit 11 [Apophysomyces ossiformis]
MTIRVVPLGAGQDVGRSCVLVTIGGKNIMFDAGFHMGFNDHRRFPDFSYISKTGNFTEVLDAVIISHFHLDHCGALPYFTEMCGYDGPIYMTHPTKAICPLLLEDYRKITVERKGETNFFTSAMIKDCMKKVTAVNLHQTIKVDDELEIKPYYAGHVLGAAMFYVRVGNESVVYTGDYNMTPDRHLGAAWIDKVRPDVLITESTYGTTIRDSKRSRERDFLHKIHECVQNGGKVIIPVFALGRAQELCILIESYWERMGMKVPVYFSTGLTERATQYYKLFINWTNEKIKSTFVHHNMFDFKHIEPWNRTYAELPGPMVLFATPGMLNIGTSLEVFKKWAPDPKNMLIMPGFCVAGTVGHKVLQGAKVVEIDTYTKVEVNLQVRVMSFSAHADAKGIMQLIRNCEPRNVVLVHGERIVMDSLSGNITKEFGIPCYHPANGVAIDIETPRNLTAKLSVDLLNSVLNESYQKRLRDGISALQPQSCIPLHGVLRTNYNGQLNGLSGTNQPQLEIVHPSQIMGDQQDHGASQQPQLTFEIAKEFNMLSLFNDMGLSDTQTIHMRVMDLLYVEIIQSLPASPKIERKATSLKVRSVTIALQDDKSGVLKILWSNEDEELANRIRGAVNRVLYTSK